MAWAETHIEGIHAARARFDTSVPEHTVIPGNWLVQAGNRNGISPGGLACHSPRSDAPGGSAGRVTG
jgi:hypothetical protein